MRRAVNELQVLCGELHVHDAAGSGLQVACSPELALDPITHRPDLLRNGTWIPDLGAVHGLAREPRDFVTQLAIAGHRSQLDQRLALPQPRVLRVIPPPSR